MKNYFDDLRSDQSVVRLGVDAPVNSGRIGTPVRTRASKLLMAPDGQIGTKRSMPYHLLVVTAAKCKMLKLKNLIFYFENPLRSRIIKVRDVTKERGGQGARSSIGVWQDPAGRRPTRAKNLGGPSTETLT